MMLAGEYQIESEGGGRTFAIYWKGNDRRDFICRYQRRENAERHIAKLKERWG